MQNTVILVYVFIISVSLFPLLLQAYHFQASNEKRSTYLIWGLVDVVWSALIFSQLTGQKLAYWQSTPVKLSRHKRPHC